MGSGGADAYRNVATTPSPESGAVSRDIQRALSQLPESQREAVTLLHVEGLSVSEVAERVGTTRGALRARDPPGL
jgi:RNA polymerase sigma factor (sigma-70 family)